MRCWPIAAVWLVATAEARIGDRHRELNNFFTSGGAYLVESVVGAAGIPVPAGPPAVQPDDEEYAAQGTGGGGPPAPPGPPPHPDPPPPPPPKSTKSSKGGPKGDPKSDKGKAPTVYKGGSSWSSDKGDSGGYYKGKAPSAYKSVDTKSPTMPKGPVKGETVGVDPKVGPPPGGSGPPKGPPKGGMTEQGAAEQSEIVPDAMARTLSVAAVWYTTESQAQATSADYEELVEVTKTLMDEIYEYSYALNSASFFITTRIDRYTIMASRLVGFQVDVYFDKYNVLPSLFQVDSIAKQGLQPTSEFYNLYLERLRAMDSPVFSTTTSFQFISNKGALAEAHAQATQQESGSRNIWVIILPVLAGVVALMAGVVLYVTYHRNKKGPHIMEEMDAIEVKYTGSAKEDQSETSATYFEDFRSRFSTNPDQQARGESDYDEVTLEDEEEVIEEEIIEEYEEEVVEEEFEEVSYEELEEVSLEEVDFKKCVAEIKKSFVARNIAELPTAQAVRAEQFGSALAPPSTNQQEPVWATPVLRHVAAPPNAELSKKPMGGGNCHKNNSRVGQSIKIPWGDDNTIDSQSSSTPEFLKKFKQMGLASKTKATSTEVNLQQRADDDQSILTIDSQASSTPEFLKKFKSMGLKRTHPS